MDVGSASQSMNGWEVESGSASQPPTVEAVEVIAPQSSVPKMMAAQPPPHTKAQHEAFMECLELYGLHTQPEHYIVDTQQERINKAQCRNLMERLCDGANKGDWYSSHILSDHNQHIFTASWHLRTLAIDIGYLVNSHFNKLAHTCRLVQRWHKHVRNKEVQVACLHEVGHARFEYKRDHQDFVAFIKRGGGGFLAPFQGGPEGIWKPMLDHDQ